MPGRAANIAAGPDGTIMMIWGNKVYKWTDMRQQKWRVVTAIE